MNGTTDSRSPSGGTQVSTVPRLFYSAEEAATATTLSRKEIYRLMEAGVLEVAEYGRRKLIVAASLHRFAEELRAATLARLTAPADAA